MPKPISLERRKQLGDFVRTRREKLKPETVGAAGGGRRRTPGLRREEAAELCGLSVTWYTWLEQGRDVSVSAPALGRLADALKFGAAERAYLFELADRRDPAHASLKREPAPPAVAAALQAITAPAYLLDIAWTALAWNAAAERLFAGWLDREGERNLLRFLFLDPAARSLIYDYEERSRRVLAEFRANLGAQLEQPRIRSLTDELRAGSGWFAKLWSEQIVQSREGGLRVFRHPQDGVRAYEQVTFNVANRPELKLTILLPEAGARSQIK